MVRTMVTGAAVRPPAPSLRKATLCVLLPPNRPSGDTTMSAVTTMMGATTWTPFPTVLVPITSIIPAARGRTLPAVLGIRVASRLTAARVAAALDAVQASISGSAIPVVTSTSMPTRPEAFTIHSINGAATPPGAAAVLAMQIL